MGNHFFTAFFLLPGMFGYACNVRKFCQASYIPVCFLTFSSLSFLKDLTIRFRMLRKHFDGVRKKKAYVCFLQDYYDEK